LSVTLQSLVTRVLRGRILDFFRVLKYNAMTSSEAEDDLSRSVSPDDSGGDQDEGDMAEHPDRREDGTNQNGSKSTSNAKDPLRPRRKKARRACFACQRAHLTCGMSACF
jgi:hypothetical protein